MKDPAKKITQREEVLDILRRARAHRLWISLHEIALGLPSSRNESSVSADLRNLRKPQYGGHKIERRYNCARSLNEFQLAEDVQVENTVEAANA